MNKQDPGPAQGLDPAVAAAIDERLSGPRPGDADLLSRVRTRVLATIRAEANPPLRTVRAGDDGWEAIAPGVTRKTLWVSAGARSCMLRLAPGAVVASHMHPMDEECVVLEGSVRIGNDLVLRAGDFHVGSKGTAHELTSSDTGALVYLRGALEEA